MSTYILTIMWPYYLILFIEIIFFTILNKKKYKDQQCFLLITMNVLFFFSAFRASTVGGDLERYLPEFNNISKESLWNILIYGYGTRERGFALLESLISLFSTAPWSFIFFNSLLYIYISYISIKNNSCNYILSAFLFFLLLYTNSYNIIRASLAVAIGLNLLQSVINRSSKKFFILLFAACLVQKTAIVLLPMYFVWNLDFKVGRLYVLLMLSLVVSFVLTGSGVVYFFNEYFNYVMQDEGEASLWSEQSEGLSNMSIFLLLLCIYILFVYSKSKISDKLIEFYITLIVFATSIQFFASIFSLVNRFSLFYYSYLIFAIPYLFKRMPKSFPILLQILILCVFVMIFLVGLSHDVQKIVPYRFVWEIN